MVHESETMESVNGSDFGTTPGTYEQVTYVYTMKRITPFDPSNGPHAPFNPMAFFPGANHGYQGTQNSGTNQMPESSRETNERTSQHPSNERPRNMGNGASQERDREHHHRRSEVHHRERAESTRRQRTEEAPSPAVSNHDERPAPRTRKVTPEVIVIDDDEPNDRHKDDAPTQATRGNEDHGARSAASDASHAGEAISRSRLLNAKFRENFSHRHAKELEHQQKSRPMVQKREAEQDSSAVDPKRQKTESQK